MTMTLGDLGAEHLGKVIRSGDLPGARLLVGVRHYRVGDEPRTSALHRDPSSKPKDSCTEYIRPSNTPIAITNA